MTKENLFIDLPPIMSWKERGKFDYWIYEVYSFELDENIAWTCLIFGVIHKDSGIIPEFLPHTQIVYTVQVVDCKLASQRLSKPSYQDLSQNQRVLEAEYHQTSPPSSHTVKNG